MSIWRASDDHLGVFHFFNLLMLPCHERIWMGETLMTVTLEFERRDQGRSRATSETVGRTTPTEETTCRVVSCPVLPRGRRRRRSVPLSEGRVHARGEELGRGVEEDHDGDYGVDQRPQGPEIGVICAELEVGIATRSKARCRGVVLSEGPMPSSLSRAELGLDDLGHVLNNFGSSSGSRSPLKTQF